jgi:hypothetical protein
MKMQATNRFVVCSSVTVVNDATSIGRRVSLAMMILCIVMVAIICFIAVITEKIKKANAFIFMVMMWNNAMSQ